MLEFTDWFKSSESGGNSDDCVEVSFSNLNSGVVGLRHSKRPEDGTLIFTNSEWTAFLKGADNGEFAI